MPIHKGHIALIDFALNYCDKLIVWVCCSENEPIPGSVRLNWVKSIFEDQSSVEPVCFEYSENDLPNTSVSSREVSKKWAEAIAKYLPKIDVIFTSELYGEYVAGFLGIEHIFFDCSKQKVPVSASEIRENPSKYWEFLPMVVRPYFVKKICIIGTESTGKTSMANDLANWLGTIAVTEAARGIVDITEQCTFNDLFTIAKVHATAILNAVKEANKFLIVDTDINITKSYARFLFDRELTVDDWIEEANKCDLYLFLENDAPFVQDGTRLPKQERDALNEFHKAEFRNKGINYCCITGTDWGARLEAAKDIIIKEYELFASQ
jgi:HTH-type transcriptional repressor of NAD biosynthesis genes